MSDRPRISVVVPLHNEEASVSLLVDGIRGSLGSEPDWELLLVDDGSQDATARIAAELAGTDGRVRFLALARNYGQTAAMQAGFDHTSGEVVVSMDGDLQNDPTDIPRLLAKLEEGYDLVAGYRVGRRDKLIARKIPSWVANLIIGWLTGVPIRDNGCSLKAYRRELLERLHLYSDMHRFIPAVAAATAGARIAQIPVRHHPRRFGKSKYGLSRVWKVLADLLTIKMIRSFRERPLAMFAVASAAAGAVALLFGIEALRALGGRHGSGLAYLVFPSTALVWLSLASYLLLVGLIAEVALGEHRRAESPSLPVVRET